MSKIYFNMDKLENDFIPALDELEKALLTAKNAASSLEVLPFGQSGYLVALPGEIGKQFSEQQKVESWIRGCIRSYNAFSEDTISSFNSIEDVEIKPRESIVVAK